MAPHRVTVQMVWADHAHDAMIIEACGEAIAWCADGRGWSREYADAILDTTYRGRKLPLPTEDTSRRIQETRQAFV